MPTVSRLKKRSDFLAVGKKGVKLKTSSFCLCALKKTKGGFDESMYCRVGYTASKKVGNAVIRNRCKRRLRALVDLYKKKYFLSTDPIDFVLIAYKGLHDRPYDLLKKEFEMTFNRYFLRNNNETFVH